MSATSWGRPVRLDAMRCSTDAVGIRTPSTSNARAEPTASAKCTCHATVMMSTLGRSPTTVTGLRRICSGVRSRACQPPCSASAEITRSAFSRVGSISRSMSCVARATPHSWTA